MNPSFPLSQTLVIQASPGIGDMIWHLPYLRAIARKEGPLTILTKSRSLAKEWLMIDPAIADVLYADRRLLSLIVPEIRRRRFKKSWILHRSFSYGLLPWLARIPARIGFGYEKQQWLLTTTEVLPAHMKSRHTIDQLRALLELTDIKVNLDDQVPPLCLQAEKAVIQRYQSCPRPWLCFGIGGSAAHRRWPQDRFIALGQQLIKHFQGTIFVCGSPAEALDVHHVQRALMTDALPGIAVAAMDLSIKQTFALLKNADFYVGNDTSLMNIAACFKTPALGLFGGSAPLTYSPYIASVIPPKGSGMNGITVEAVWQTILSQDVLRIEC